MLQTPAGREGKGAELVRGAPAERERQLALGISTENTLAMSSRCCCTGMSGKVHFCQIHWRNCFGMVHWHEHASSKQCHEQRNCSDTRAIYQFSELESRVID